MSLFTKPAWFSSTLKCLKAYNSDTAAHTESLGLQSVTDNPASARFKSVIVFWTPNKTCALTLQSFPESHCCTSSRVSIALFTLCLGAMTENCTIWKQFGESEGVTDHIQHTTQTKYESYEHKLYKKISMQRGHSLLYSLLIQKPLSLANCLETKWNVALINIYNKVTQIRQPYSPHFRCHQTKAPCAPAWHGVLRWSRRPGRPPSSPLLV